MKLQPEVQVFEPFSPVIMEFWADTEAVAYINKLADQGGADWSDKLVGKISREVRLPDDDKVAELLTGSGYTYMKYMIETNRMDKSMESVELTDAWVNSQYAGEFNPLHHHTGDLSGVLYLKLPDGYAAEMAEERESYEPSRGMLQCIYGERSDYRIESKTFIPEVGKLILFPSTMRHAVYPFYSDGERRSMGFNLEVI